MRPHIEHLFFIIIIIINLVGTIWRTLWWGDTVLLCVTASTEYCCSKAGRRTRAELLTWSFQNNLLKYVQYACVCVHVCVRACLCVQCNKAAWCWSRSLMACPLSRLLLWLIHLCKKSLLPSRSAIFQLLPCLMLSLPSVLLLTGALWKAVSILRRWHSGCGASSQRSTAKLDTFNSHISSVCECVHERGGGEVNHRGLHQTKRPFKPVSVFTELIHRLVMEIH